MPSFLIACDVFAAEVAALAHTAPLAGTLWLEMGLHDNPARLRGSLQDAVARASAAPDVERIVLGYGLCGRGLAGLRADRVPLILPRAHDCISILLGGVERHQAVLREEPGTYFYSPGWIRGKRVPGPDREAHARALYTARHPDDPETVEDLVQADRETFLHHKRAAYVDLTHDRAAEDYCRSCAAHLGWEFTRLTGDPAFLRTLLTGPWDDARFLTVPPGLSVTQTSDGTLRAA
jgi:hypothetical protein